jgi:hypothetical protein
MAAANATRSRRGAMVAKRRSAGKSNLHLQISASPAGRGRLSILSSVAARASASSSPVDCSYVRGEHPYKAYVAGRMDGAVNAAQDSFREMRLSAAHHGLGRRA